VVTNAASDVDELRAALARKLRRDGSARHANVERAFRRVPRQFFLPDVEPDLVYRDSPIPTKLQAGEITSSSSQPSIMAIMLEQLRLGRGQRVLEIGAGTGYNAALLAEIVGPRGKVTTIDLDADTVQRASSVLLATGYPRVHVAQADGLAGYPAHAPYDRIIAAVGLGDIPTAWRDQLKPGGYLVLPLAIRGVMKSFGLRRDRRGRLTSTSLAPAQFMPIRGVSPLLSRLVRLGPELGLFAWFPAERGPGDADRLYATLQRPPVDLATGLRLTRAQVRSGLNLWIRAHEQAVIMLQAEGALVETGIVPGFGNEWGSFATRERSTLGLFEHESVALLAWQTEAPDAGQNPPGELAIRAFGQHGPLTERLLACVQAWLKAGAPTDDALEVRLGATPRATDAVVPIPSGELVLRWKRLAEARARCSTRG
jgi:protein-L-isoaspartate(D-aspartate) O-methyltransferase